MTTQVTVILSIMGLTKSYDAKLMLQSQLTLPPLLVYPTPYSQSLFSVAWGSIYSFGAALNLPE
jgi:hypothetical protein